MSTAANGRNLPAVMEPDQIDRGYGTPPVVRYTLSDMEVMAKKAAASRMFSLDENQALTLMLICEAEGLHPIQALRRYHVIQGRPAMRADAILGEMMRHDWAVEWTSDSRDRAMQEAVFSHARKCPNGKSVSFTIEDAKVAGLAGKDNWRNHTPAMLRARVISTACRMLDPGIIAGIYTADEIEGTAASAPAESPRRSALRDALDAAKGRTQAPAPSAEAPMPPRSEFGAWLDVRIADAHAIWSRAAAGGGVDPGRPVSRQQVGRHLIKAWIAQGTLDEADVRTHGKRDPAREAAVISQAWAADPDDVAGEVDDYLSCVIRERAAAANIDLPADEDPADDAPDEAMAMADEDPADA